MAIFHCYVCSPEGKFTALFDSQLTGLRVMIPTIFAELKPGFTSATDFKWFLAMPTPKSTFTPKATQIIFPVTDDRFQKEVLYLWLSILQPVRIRELAEMIITSLTSSKLQNSRGTVVHLGVHYGLRAL